jgi:hypothetical protein
MYMCAKYIYIIHIPGIFGIMTPALNDPSWNPVPCRPGNPATVKTLEVAHRRRRSSPGPLVVPGLWTAMGYGYDQCDF